MAHRSEKFYERGEKSAGYVTTFQTQVTEARSLPSRDFCPIGRADNSQGWSLELRTGRIWNIYTDSRGVLAILHAQGSIWKERVVVTAENEQLKHGLSILKPLELVQLPKRWQWLMVGVTKQGGGSGGQSWGKQGRLNCQTVAWEPVTWQPPLIPQGPDPSNYPPVYIRKN